MQFVSCHYYLFQNPNLYINWRFFLSIHMTLSIYVWSKIISIHKIFFSISRQIFVFSKSASDCARSTRWMQSYYTELLTTNSVQRASPWLSMLLKVQHTNLKIPHSSAHIRCQSSKLEIQSLTCIKSLYSWGFFGVGGCVCVCVWTVITAICFEKSKK